MRTLIVLATFATGVALGWRAKAGLYWFFMHSQPKTHPDSKPRFYHNGEPVESWPT